MKRKPRRTARARSASVKRAPGQSGRLGRAAVGRVRGANECARRACTAGSGSNARRRMRLSGLRFIKVGARRPVRAPRAAMADERRRKLMVAHLFLDGCEQRVIFVRVVLINLVLSGDLIDSPEIDAAPAQVRQNLLVLSLHAL